MSKMEATTKDVWAVWVNTDKTEGRGANVVMCFCELEATARRMAHKANVQGSNGYVRRQTLYQLNSHEWLGPVHIQTATREDVAQEKQIQRKRQALARARELGLTEGEITALAEKGEE